MGRIIVEADSFSFCKVLHVGAIELPKGVGLLCKECNHSHGQPVIFTVLPGRKAWKFVRLGMDCGYCGKRTSAILGFENHQMEEKSSLPFPVSLPVMSYNPHERRFYCRNCVHPLGFDNFALKLHQDIFVLAADCPHCRTYTTPIIRW